MQYAPSIKSWEGYLFTKKRFEGLLHFEFKGRGKLEPYLRFRDLARKYGLSDAYDFEYKLLSFFVHPTFLYLLTTTPRDKTVSKQKRELALRNVKHRKLMVKSLATKLAFGLSSRTITHIEMLVESSFKEIMI